MADIRIKDIRVLPSSLDLKNNAGKSLSEILGQLQSGSIVKGLVVGTTPKGEAIFHTAHGRFAAKNDINLVRGDTISLKLAHDNQNLSGTIISVNDKKRDNAEPVKLSLPSTLDNTKSSLSSNKSSNAVNFSNNSNIPKIINGEISYLNLSKIEKNTPLFRVLNSITVPETNKINISLNVVSNKQSANSAFIISGEVSGNAKNGDQLIKTDFGVISSKNTGMLVGQKLKLEITDVNNQSLANSTTKSVNDFLFLANKNWPLLKNLVQTIQGGNTQSSSIISNSAKTQQTNVTNSMVSRASPDLSSTTIEQTKQGSNSSTSSINVKKSDSNQSPIALKTDPQATHKSPNISAIASQEQTMSKAMALSGSNEIKEIIANAEKLQSLTLKNIKTRSRNNNSISEENQLSRRSIREQSSSNNVQAPQPKDKASINHIIKSLDQHEEIRKISSELTNLKELILPTISERESPEKWQTVFIPFFNGRNVENHEVKIQKSREHYLRFIIEVNLLDNPMQIDGLIKFKNDNRTPENFDLTVRSKKSLDQYIQSRIAEIYQLNQNLSGVGGILAIEQQNF